MPTHFPNRLEWKADISYNVLHRRTDWTMYEKAEERKKEDKWRGEEWNGEEMRREERRREERRREE